jgi:nucleoside-diphosphate-sugar epimerase
MQKEYILLTGGAGFIGSTLAEELLHNKINVLCVDNFDPFYDKAIKLSNLQSMLVLENFSFIEGDVTDAIFVDSLFSAHSIRAVVHLAAKAGVRPSINNPDDYLNVNIGGTLTLLEGMRKHGIKKLIFSSSSSVYGNNKKIPYSETDNVDYPISPYAASKKSGELLTYTYYNLYGIDTINIRFFTVYGPRQRPDLAIHKFFKNLYSTSPIDLYGDGRTSRDYTYVGDIVAGTLLAIQYVLENERVYETINLGNGQPVELLELIRSIEEITGKQFTIRHFPHQEGDVDHTFADITKAQYLLGYKPVTSLEDGLLHFKNWYEKINLPIR